MTLQQQEISSPCKTSYNSPVLIKVAFGGSLTLEISFDVVSVPCRHLRGINHDIEAIRRIM